MKPREEIYDQAQWIQELHLSWSQSFPIQKNGTILWIHFWKTAHAAVIDGNSPMLTIHSREKKPSILWWKPFRRHYSTAEKSPGIVKIAPINIKYRPPLEILVQNYCRNLWKKVIFIDTDPMRERNASSRITTGCIASLPRRLQPNRRHPSWLEGVAFRLQFRRNYSRWHQLVGKK